MTATSSTAARRLLPRPPTAVHVELCALPPTARLLALTVSVLFSHAMLVSLIVTVTTATAVRLPSILSLTVAHARLHVLLPTLSETVLLRLVLFTNALLDLTTVMAASRTDVKPTLVRFPTAEPVETSVRLSTERPLAPTVPVKSLAVTLVGETATRASTLDVRFLSTPSPTVVSVEMLVLTPTECLAVTETSARTVPASLDLLIATTTLLTVAKLILLHFLTVEHVETLALSTMPRLSVLLESAKLHLVMPALETVMETFELDVTQILRL